MSNAADQAPAELRTGRTSIPDGQLYTCSYAQLLALMDASAHGTAVLLAERFDHLALNALAELADLRGHACPVPIPFWVSMWPLCPRTGCSIRCGRTCPSVTPPSSGRQTRAWAAGPGGGARRPRARTGRTGRLRLRVKDLEYPRRAEPPKDGLSEREMLEALLEFRRTTLLLKCEGADDHARKARPVATSRLSLHGLVRHMAEVERSWF